MRWKILSNKSSKSSATTTTFSLENLETTLEFQRLKFRKTLNPQLLFALNIERKFTLKSWR